MMGGIHGDAHAIDQAAKSIGLIHSICSVRQAKVNQTNIGHLHLLKTVI